MCERVSECSSNIALSSAQLQLLGFGISFGLHSSSLTLKYSSVLSFSTVRERERRQEGERSSRRGGRNGRLERRVVAEWNDWVQPPEAERRGAARLGAEH